MDRGSWALLTSATGTSRESCVPGSRYRRIANNIPPAERFRAVANSRNSSPPPFLPRTKKGMEMGKRSQSRRSATDTLRRTLFSFPVWCNSTAKHPNPPTYPDSGVWSESGRPSRGSNCKSMQRFALGKKGISPARMNSFSHYGKYFALILKSYAIFYLNFGHGCGNMFSPPNEVQQQAP